MTLESAGEISQREVRHRVTTSGHVVTMLEKSGFDIVGLFGGIDGSSFTVGAPTLIVVAARR